MSFRIGSKCRVTLGPSTVVGMGTWTLTGVTADKIEVTAFGDDWKSYMFGLMDGGEISFEGFFDPDDVMGQNPLCLANLKGNRVTSLRLWIDDTSYFTPCQTTGYFSPTATTGQPTRASYVNITYYDVKADKSNVAQCSFKATVSGVMVLV